MTPIQPPALRSNSGGHGRRLLCCGCRARHGRRRHEQALRGAVDRLVEVATDPEPDWAGAALGLFRSSISAVPYVPAMALLGRETTRLAAASERPRVAVIANGIGSTHGVTRTLAEIAERGVPGFDV